MVIGLMREKKRYKQLIMAANEIKLQSWHTHGYNKSLLTILKIAALHNTVNVCPFRAVGYILETTYHPSKSMNKQKGHDEFSISWHDVFFLPHNIALIYFWMMFSLCLLLHIRSIVKKYLPL
jgi:hypothetical protein